MAASQTMDGRAPSPAQTTGGRRNWDRGRRVQRIDAWGEIATWAHQRWIYRRDRSPWLYVLPIAVIAALLAR